MEIHGLVVCVNYADHLARSLPIWARTLDSLVVVTTLADEVTQELVDATPGVFAWLTDAFYRDGATFNKGRAMQEARSLLPLPSGEGRGEGPSAKNPWHLFFDADVIPPADWKQRLEAANPQPGWLYGASRVEEDGRWIPDGEIAGYFQLFYAADPRAAEALDIYWSHAGNYDSRFAHRWPGNMKAFVPDLQLTHLGERGVNWCGRGNTEAMNAVRSERQRRGGWLHESIRIAEPLTPGP